MERIKERLGFANGLFVPSHGRSDGLVLMWMRETNLEIKSFSYHHIDAIVMEENSNFKWRITGFYGHPQTHLRQSSWDLLIFLRNQFQLPWFCYCDFNEILSMEEKSGGALRPQSQMDRFRDAVNLCGFKDLGYSGPNFTWCNMQAGDSRVYLRLDRALASTDWIDKFGEVRVNHLVESTSDHCVLFISDPETRKQSRARRFHFEAMWTKCKDYKNIIEAAWSTGDNLNTLEGMVSTLNACAADRKAWSSATFGQIPKKIQEKKKRLSSLV